MINESKLLYRALVQQKRDGSLANYQAVEDCLERFDTAVNRSVGRGYIVDDLDVLLQAKNFTRLESLLFDVAPDMTIKSILYDSYDVYIGLDEDGWFQMSDHDDDPVYEEESVPIRKRKLGVMDILAIVMVLIVFVHFGRAVQSGDFAGYWEPEVTVPIDMR